MFFYYTQNSLISYLINLKKFKHSLKQNQPKYKVKTKISKDKKQLIFQFQIIIFYTTLTMIFWAVLFSFVFFLFYVIGTFAALGLIFVIIGSLMSLVYFKQNMLLYMPKIPDMPLSPSQNPLGYRHPSQKGLEAVDLALKTEDGLSIRGWHIKKQRATQLIIYFHQNAGNIGFRIPLLKQLNERTNSEIVLVAYRGYSDSDGYPTEEGLQIDAETIINYAIQYCAKQNPKLDIFLYGRSLGGAVSVYLASHQKYRNKIKGVILQNTFTSISDMIDAIMPIFKYMKFLQRNHWKSIERVPKIQKPILFIRSLRDELVPTSHMVRLYQNVDNGLYVEEYQIEYGTHNSSWELDMEEYFGKIVNFIAHPQVQRESSKKLNSQMKKAYKSSQPQYSQLL